MRFTRIIRGLLLVAVGIPLLQIPCLFAQCSFTNGGTGVDGAFTPTNSMPNTGWSIISNNVILVTNKANGVFNFTSINISNAWVVKFTRNTLNTPVYLLATNNVIISGTIDISGGDAPPSPSIAFGSGGPGGFDGGQGQGSSSSPNYEGYGLGPGTATNAYVYNAGFSTFVNCNSPGITYGTIDNQPLIGGSGGGGGTSGGNLGGAGGGGALLIASSGTIDVEGSILANGGRANGSIGGGGGSGGAIRLIATTIKGGGLIQALGGSSACQGGGDGRIRFESCLNQLTFLSAPPATLGFPGAVILSTNPTIQVTAIAGQNVSWPPTGSLNSADVYLPTNFVNPATISVSTSNVVTGTAFRVIITPASGTNLVANGSLTSGNYASASGTVSMNVYTDRIWRVNALIDHIARP